MLFSPSLSQCAQLHHPKASDKVNLDIRLGVEIPAGTLLPHHPLLFYTKNAT